MLPDNPPLELRRYGGVLRRLRHSDIERVRQWRNDPRISQHMRFRGHITPEMQEAWFQSVDNDSNYFFIIEDQAGSPLGMTEVKRIDRVAREAEVGIFFYHEEKLTPLTAYQSYFNLLDFAFEGLALLRIKAGVLGSNQRAIRFSVGCGFVKQSEDPEGFGLWLLTPEAYEAKTRGIKKILQR